MVSMEAFEIYAANHDIHVMDFVLKLDAYSYYMMNLLDYLIGNTDPCPFPCLQPRPATGETGDFWWTTAQTSRYACLT